MNHQESFFCIDRQRMCRIRWYFPRRIACPLCQRVYGSCSGKRLFEPSGKFIVYGAMRFKVKHP